MNLVSLERHVFRYAGLSPLWNGKQSVLSSILFSVQWSLKLVILRQGDVKWRGKICSTLCWALLGRIRYFVVLGNETFSVYQREPPFGMGSSQQGIHVCITGVSTAATFVVYNQCVCQVLGFALENRLPDSLGGKNYTSPSHLLMVQSFRIAACLFWC